MIVLVAVVGGALGIAVESLSASAPGPAAADLVTGWTLFGAAIWGLAQRPAEPRWWLMAAAGAAWFAGSFSGAAVGASLVYLHRGPLVHATAAATRRRSALVAVPVVLGYADSLVVGRTANGWITA